MRLVRGRCSSRAAHLALMGMAFLLAFGGRVLLPSAPPEGTKGLTGHGEILEVVETAGSASLPAAAVLAGASSGWWGEVQSAIARLEYEPQVGPGGVGIEAPNRAHDFRVTFGPGGVEIAPRRSESAGDWRLAWRLSSWGRPGHRMAAGSGTVVPTADGSRVVYARGELVEWYENTADGLEQGFTIPDRPPGEGTLHLEGRIDGGLRPALAGDGAIEFFSDAHACVLRYGKLQVWDAVGRDIPSRLALSGERLSIVIEDDAATRYPLTVDPIWTAPAWSYESNQAFAHLGASVATAGDVNGDGRSDVIVGAPQFDNGQDLEGRAFVFHGTASGVSSVPSWTGESNVTNARFGSDVACAGDVNGDGFADVIIGAFAYTNGQTSEGRAYLYLGSAAGLPASPAWTVESNQIGGFLGASVATAGDVNGDGRSDVIVGASLYDNGEIDEGRAFVYHGSAAGLSATAAWSAESNQAAAEFGGCVATAGDLNGDGYADVVVGAKDYDNGQTGEGRAYVYHGSPSGLSASANWTGESNQTAAFFGRSAGTAGDVNGDGYADVVIGASGYANGQASEGRAYVYHGSAAGLSPSATWIQESNNVAAQYGYSAGTAGDVNGDGYADVVVGAPLYSGNSPREGRIYVYQGSEVGLSSNFVTAIESDQTDSRFGWRVATAGDVNGDGLSDVMAGAYLFDNGQGDEGKAFVYLGATSGPTPAPAWIAESNQTDAYFATVAGAGDVNGDGFSDVIVGAWGYDNGESQEGRAFTFHGSAAGLSTIPSWFAEPNRANAHFGFAVDGAGDVNGDGYGDVIVSALMYSLGAVAGINGDGRVFVYHGSATGLGAIPAWTAEADQEQTTFGRSCGKAGDVNGDGFADVIIGASLYSNGESSEGRAFVYEGSPAGLTSFPAWFADGNQAEAQLGFAVATAGDVNGDGYSDVVVGAPTFENGQAAEGRAYLYEGSPSGLSPTPSWSVEGNVNLANLALRVASAGDVNGDGYSDVLVGSYHYTNGEAEEGKVFLYQGSASGLSTTPDWSVESNADGFALGYSLDSAGDVNGDGFSDVIISAPLFSLNEPARPRSRTVSEAAHRAEAREGRAYVFPGSTAGLAPVPLWEAGSVQDGSYFGISVAGAGDVNGDGFSDVIAGSQLYDNGETDEGRAFLYYGNNGDGLHRIPRQARADDTAPIDLLGRSSSVSAFRVKTLGRTPAGRGRVRLDAEVKPLGVPFDGSGLLTGGLTSTGTPGPAGSAVPLVLSVGGLSPGSPYHWRVRMRSDSPFFPRSLWFSLPGNAPGETDLRTAFTIGVDGVATVPPAGLILGPNAPNPFRTATDITYTLPHAGRCRLAVYDVMGQHVAQLVDEEQAAGRHQIRWDGRTASGERLPAGVYLARIEIGERVEARKIVIAPR
jgi:FG-GAP repeat/FlgD Ig-like domain/FG-GAP-like repeat